MDNRTDTVYVDFTLANHRIRYFLSYLIAIKGLNMVPVELGKQRTPAIRYAGLTVDGLPAVTEYILESKPMPELLPQDPKRRALIRNFTGAVLLHEIDLGNLHPLYYNSLPIPAQRITMLDLAIAACAKPDLTTDLKWINLVRDSVESALNTTSQWHHKLQNGELEDA